MNKKNRIKSKDFKEIKGILHRAALRLDKTARDIAQLQENQKKSHERLKKIIAKLQESQGKLSEQIAKLQEIQKKTDEQIRTTERLVERAKKTGR